MAQAIGDGIVRKARVVLAAGESLFLGGGHNLPIAHQARRRVVIETGDAEHVHSNRYPCFLISSRLALPILLSIQNVLVPCCLKGRKWWRASLLTTQIGATT